MVDRAAAGARVGGSATAGVAALGDLQLYEGLQLKDEAAVVGGVAVGAGAGGASAGAGGAGAAGGAAGGSSRWSWSTRGGAAVAVG